MANVVEIVIRVDNANAKAAMEATRDAVRELGVASEVSMGRMAKGSGDAAQGLDKVAKAAGDMGKHIATSLDGVRLMSQEFGFRLPRALESMLSRIPAVTGAIQGMMGAFAGIAFAEVFVRMGQAAFNLYEKYISLSAAAKTYNEEVQKHRDEAFVDTHSIEVTTERINEATTAAKAFKDAGEQIHNSAWADLFSGDANRMGLGFASLLNARQMTDSGYKSQGQADALKVKQVEQEHEIARLKIEQQHAGDGALQGQAKLNAELQKQIQLHQEDQNYSRQRDSALQPFGMKDGGAQKRDIDNDIVQREIGAKRIELQREITSKTIELQNEAANAGLQGSALMVAQEQQAIAAIGRSAIGTLAQIQAVKDKYAAESRKHIDEEIEAAKQRAQIEGDAGLTGLAKVQAEGQRKVDDVNQRRAKGLYFSGSAADQDEATAKAEQLRMMADAEKQYRETEAAEDQRAQAEQLSGFAKIDAEVAASAQKRADEFAKMYGQMSHDSASYLQAQQALEQSEAIIAQSGDRQRAQLEQEIRQQTLQQQTEAAQAERRVRGAGIAGWTDDYKRGIAEIQAAEAASIAKINAEQGKPGTTGAAFDLYQQQKIAAEQKADAQITELNQQMAHQIAGVLQGAFDDPVHYIQNLMKKMMFNIMADWIMQSKAFGGTFGRMLGGGGTGASTGSNGGFTGGGIGGMLGGFGGAGGAANGTVSQASVAPGYGGTASGGGGSVGGSIASLTQMGMGTAAALSTGRTSGSDATSDPWSDPSQMSSSDPSSPAYNGAAGNAATSAMTLGGLVTAGVGAYTGTRGMIGAFEQGSPGGILNGAASGAAMGGSVGALFGPLGAPIGAGIGAAGGAAAGLVGWATGEGGNLAASKYFKGTMRPQMEAAETSYAKGGGDALSAISSIDSIAAAGLAYIGGKYGATTLAWTRAAYVDKERTYLEQQINSMAKGGKDYMSRSAGQFHSGGDISDFGDLSLGGGEGFIKALLGEKVANRSASSIHGSEIDMMNNGASPSDMASHYLKTTGGVQSQAAQGGSGDTHHWNVNAIDASSFERFLTHGGGMNAVAKASNRFASQYAGDAASV